MFILISVADLAHLSAACREELLVNLRPQQAASGLPIPAPLIPEALAAFEGIHITDVEDITFKNMGLLMEGLPSVIREGLRLIAEHGPVISAALLDESGINIRRFQSGTTRRVRALTSDRRAYLLGWDDWAVAGDGRGRYAVTPITHQSLRRYFGFTLPG